MPDAAEDREAARLLACTADEGRGINQLVEAGFGPTVLDRLSTEAESAAA